MDIVDAQLHFGPAGLKMGADRFEADPSIIQSTLEAMDSLGIQSVLLDEFWYWAANFNPEQNLPGHELPNGAWRSIYPLAQLASILHPDRFSYFVRIDRRDPQLDSVMRVLASSPQARAFRVLPARSSTEVKQFIDGAYDELFALAQELERPICIFIPGYVEYLPRYLKKFPRLQFVVDHWGMGIAHNMTERPESEFTRSFSPEYFEEILKLSQHPNVAIKLSHGQMHFRATEYPFEPVRAYIRRAIEAFGADRLLWATDKTVAHPMLSWGELLYSIKDSPELSREEKELILGKNARRIFAWPAQG
jgi:L-fuconolactonase